MWNRKEVGSKRSIIRRISNWLPVILPPKIYIKVNVIKNSLNKFEKSLESNSSYPKSHDGLNLITTLFDKTTDNYIYCRANVSVIGTKSINTDRKKCLLHPEISNVSFVVPEPRSSTPISFLHNKNTISNQSALVRISQLEDELATLRQQIASIVISQENSTLKTTSVVKTLPASLPALLPPPPLPPPPPPPPPPLSLQSLSQSHFHVKNQLDKSKFHDKRKQKVIVTKTNTPNTGSGDHKPDMSEILKGINSVKLRHIERSPGGTPIRKPPLPREPSDPASLLAEALKRRFLRIHPHEQSPEKENQESFESLPFSENSPLSLSNKAKTKLFGPHLLKPVKKKREMKSSSPLIEMNE